MHFGGNKGAGNPWQQLIREFAPDIVFAQESFHPDQYFSPDELAQYKGCIWSAVPERNWGSAILSKQYQLEPVSLPEFEGWVVGARVPDLVINGVSQAVMIFSIHAPSPGPYEPAVKKIFDEIAKKWNKVPLIVAGDFNLTTAIRHPTENLKNSTGEIALQKRLRKEFGLSNAWQVLHPNQNLPQTLRWNKDPVPPYHCDAVFLSHNHLAHLVSSNIESSGIWTGMSDHNPIVVTLE
jgi:exonuclease III